MIAVPDERRGEVPAAFVALHEGASVLEEGIEEHVRERLARLKAPNRVVFGELLKTSTGKVQKFVLRDRAWEGPNGGSRERGAGEAAQRTVNAAAACVRPRRRGP